MRPCNWRILLCDFRVHELKKQQRRCVSDLACEWQYRKQCVRFSQISERPRAWPQKEWTCSFFLKRRRSCRRSFSKSLRNQHTINPSDVHTSGLGTGLGTGMTAERPRWLGRTTAEPPRSRPRSSPRSSPRWFRGRPPNDRGRSAVMSEVIPEVIVEVIRPECLKTYFNIFRLFITIPVLFLSQTILKFRMLLK